MKIISSFLVAGLFVLVVGNKPTTAETCDYNPNLGKPNPLGMRAYITARTDKGNTIFVFEQFPSIVGEKITIANKRELVFYGINIKKARQILLKNPQYYSELVGYEDPEGSAPVNTVLTCR